MYVARFGALPGNRPESYWRWWMGKEIHLRPCDLGDVTPIELMDAYTALMKHG